MVAFQYGTIHDVATKVGDYNKTGGVPPPQPQAVTEHMMQLLRFMALRVQLVILASAFVAGSTYW